MGTEEIPGQIPAHCAVASLSDADWLLVAVLACPLSQAGAPTNVLAGAVAAASGEGAPSRWPSRLAGELHARLAALGAAYGWGFFAAVAATRDRILVAHAGDLRVHLVSDGTLARVTRDHVVANESPDWLRATYGDTDLSTHRTMATRSLGAEPLRLEEDEWPTGGELRLFLCDADFHRHRAPAEYAAEALGRARPPSTAGLAVWFARAWR
jgi:hypothetical protein